MQASSSTKNGVNRLLGTESLKVHANSKALVSRKCSKNYQSFKVKNEETEAINYLMCYKATAEVIFDRVFNVTIVCQIIKPLIKPEIPYTHQAIFTLIRSASNIFLMELLGEFYDLKSNLLESEEKIINDIQGKTIEEKTSNIIKWLMKFQINQ